MISAPQALPEGRPGQLLALAVLFVGLAVLWFGAIMPAVSWYAGRAEQLAVDQRDIAHVKALRRDLPSLRAAAAASAAQATDDAVLLTGDSDAIAGANLQAEVQTLATQTGISLDSVADLPAEQTGGLRQISVDVGVTAAWPALITLLSAIETASPRMIVDDLSITGLPQADSQQDTSLDVSFSVAAFRAGDAP
jgi:general secretion pathway protein M